jgi:hypothetical protein
MLLLPQNGNRSSFSSLYLQKLEKADSKNCYNNNNTKAVINLNLCPASKTHKYLERHTVSKYVQNLIVCSPKYHYHDFMYCFISLISSLEYFNLTKRICTKNVKIPSNCCLSILICPDHYRGCRIHKAIRAFLLHEREWSDCLYRRNSIC